MKILSAAFFLFFTGSAFGQLYSTGLVFNDANYQKAKMRPNFNPEDYLYLPNSASIKKYCPKPGNQLQLSTSPSWAVTWSAQTILDAKKHNWVDQSKITQNTYSPAFNYYHIRSPQDEKCEEGVDLFDALNFLKFSGAKQYDEFLEFCPRGIPKEILDRGNLKSISDFIRLFNDDHPDKYKINAVKKAIVENYPVVIGMYCPPSFYDAKGFWQPKELPGNEYPGHSLCVIGYDDDMYGGSFEIINSWGTQWANDGFLWIRYENFLDFTKYAYEVFNIERSENDTFDFISSINLKLNDDSSVEMEIDDNGFFRTTRPLSTGTYFRVHINNLSPAYVYVFGVDESQKLYKVFPHLENISPALIYEVNEVALPGVDKYIEIIGDPGKENLCILYSKEEINFNELIYNLDRFPGDMYENLDALLQGKVITPDHMSWKNGTIQFKSENQDKKVVLIQIQIDHI